DEHTDQTAHDGAVDADELQVATDVQLDALRGLHAVPPLDGLGDHRSELAAVAVDHEDGRVAEHPVESFLEGDVVSHPRTELDQFGTDTLGESALRIGQG